MPEFKEKPKMGRPKAKPPSAMHPKQAARMMKEKYLQQLDQRPEGTDSETSYATDQVEGAGRWATDEAVSHTPGPASAGKTPQRNGLAPRAIQIPPRAELPKSQSNSQNVTPPTLPNRGRDPASGRPTLPKSARPPP